MKHQCAGFKASGEQCSLSVPLSYTFCHLHDPGREEERKRITSKAGRSRPQKELKEIKHSLKELAKDVLEGTVERSRGAVAAQVYNVLLRALSEEHKQRELEEVEARITELEKHYEAREETRGRRW